MGSDTIGDMRQFIVTNPNLSVGKPGDIVTAEQLRMTDAQLDEWVGAGYGVEIGTPVPADDDIDLDDDWDDIDWEPSGDAAAGLFGEETSGEFNPHIHTVDEVRAYIDDHPDEAAHVRDLEAGGKNRSSIVKYKAT